MKKMLFLLMLVLASTILKAQYNTVTLYFASGKMEDAKKEVDKLMTDPKTQDKPQTYLWKANVYAEIYYDSSLSPKYPDAGEQAFDAVLKYAEKAPDLKDLKDNARAVSLLYSGSFNRGRDAFQKKDWNSSFDNFAFCQKVGEFAGKNSLTTNGKYTIDTIVVLYCGYAAQNAGKYAEAAARYKALADWKLNDKDDEDIYKYILDYDTKQKDENSFKKYLAVAKEAYPSDMAIWNQFEMNYLSNNSSINDIVNKYKADDAAGKLNEDGYITYAESFASPDKSQLDQLDSAQKIDLKLTAADAYAKAYNLNNAAGIYAFNVGLLYYNVFGELDDRFYNYRGESAPLKAKRDEILKEQAQYADKSVDWLEKAYTTLKAKANRDKNESNSLNRSVDYLANLYAWKRDRSKGVDPKAYDAYDAKFKLYDSEHDKYKQ